MRCTRLVERGQLLLSRANSSSRKTGRQDSRVHPSQNDSSATALQAHDGARGAAARPSPSPSAGTAQNGKGATDFRVQGLRNDTPPTSLTNSLPVLNRHEMGDEAAAPPAVPIHRQRRAKLIRDPSNTCHQRRNRASRFSQSMDFVRSQSTEFRQRHNRLSHLFSCCSPMSLFRRGTSYGSMRTDANQETSPDGQQEQTQRPSGMHGDAGESLYGHEQMAERQHDDLPARGHHSATETAVAVGSLDDHSPESSKAPSTPSNGPQIVGAPEDTDDANESDWLVSRADKERSSTSDYSSPGSGLPGVGATYASAMPVPRAQAQASGLATYNSTYSDLDTDAGISTPGDSVYRTPPTSLGDMTNSTSNAQRTGNSQPQHAADASSQKHEGVASETPANTINRLYLEDDDDTYEHVPRRMTLETSSADPESIGEDDFESDEEAELRAEITSPPGNIATDSSERLVTHVDGQALLPRLAPELKGRKCLVLDLDETLVHSSFREVENPDFIVPVVLEGQEHNVYVVKRPGVDEFIRVMGQYYEVVVFTASLSMYADPVLDLLDKHKAMHHRLFRESCNLYNGNYVKDLSRLGRDVSQSIIIDNSPASYAFHPNNAIGISTWLNDPMDTELRDLIPFLIDLTKVDDVSAVLSLTHNHAASTAT
ncbi:hypothetical protein LPJ78_001869 [Coemansia sp. RSA 989]|nr:hypothetical protein LPJ79_001850 [Coemansia sp. RSA 1821]KAJ1866404.1 hypothetical protein LPJ78_001869 [Coemansia sp. RSA 989]KAJ1872963.1 hypothetical protein LPJ55_002677 [Coemansia sp. RSA 990]